MSKFCKDCPDFEIQAKPDMPWHQGIAVCKKYVLIIDFADSRKLNRLTCVEEKGALFGLLMAVNHELGGEAWKN